MAEDLDGPLVFPLLYAEYNSHGLYSREPRSCSALALVAVDPPIECRRVDTQRLPLLGGFRLPPPESAIWPSPETRFWAHELQAASQICTARRSAGGWLVACRAYLGSGSFLCQ